MQKFRTRCKESRTSSTVCPPELFLTNRFKVLSPHEKEFEQYARSGEYKVPFLPTDFYIYINNSSVCTLEVQYETKNVFFRMIHTLRIMGYQNWWFGDSRPLLCTSKPLLFGGSNDSWGIFFFRMIHIKNS